MSHMVTSSLVASVIFLSFLILLKIFRLLIMVTTSRWRKNLKSSIVSTPVTKGRTVMLTFGIGHLTRVTRSRRENSGLEDSLGWEHPITKACSAHREALLKYSTPFEWYSGLAQKVSIQTLAYLAFSSVNYVWRVIKFVCRSLSAQNTMRTNIRYDIFAVYI